MLVLIIMGCIAVATWAAGVVFIVNMSNCDSNTHNLSTNTHRIRR